MQDEATADHERVASLFDDVRYCVFLVPDPSTSAAVSTITGFVCSQFGLVSAARFPPHVTLVGSLPVAVGVDDLLNVVAEVTAAHPAFWVHNRGIIRLHEKVVVFDVHHDSAGQPNVALADLAADLADRVGCLLRPASGLAPDVREREEVDTFIRGLPVPHPDGFLARTVTVVRLLHPTWTGAWWTTFEWEHLRSFRLPDG